MTDTPEVLNSTDPILASAEKFSIDPSDIDSPEKLQAFMADTLDEPRTELDFVNPDKVPFSVPYGVTHAVVLETTEEETVFALAEVQQTPDGVTLVLPAAEGPFIKVSLADASFAPGVKVYMVKAEDIGTSDVEVTLSSAKDYEITLDPDDLSDLYTNSLPRKLMEVGAMGEVQVSLMGIDPTSPEQLDRLAKDESGRFWLVDMGLPLKGDPATVYVFYRAPNQHVLGAETLFYPETAPLFSSNSALVRGRGAVSMPRLLDKAPEASSLREIADFVVGARSSNRLILMVAEARE